MMGRSTKSERVATFEATGQRTLVPGFDLDNQVSQAVGFPVRNPSTKLDAAMVAANAIGLFRDGKHFLFYRDDRWRVNTTRFVGYEFADDSEVSRGETPALAVCGAVLRLYVEARIQEARAQTS